MKGNERKKGKAQPAKIIKLRGGLVMRTGSGYPEAARGSRSSGHVAQLG